MARRHTGTAAPAGGWRGATGSVGAEKPRPAPHMQPGPPRQPRPLLPGPGPGMWSCLSVPVFIWQNSPFPFRVRRIDSVTATVCPGGEKARREDQKTRGEQSFRSVVQPRQSRSRPEAGGQKTRLGQSGLGAGSAQAVPFLVTQAVSSVPLGRPGDGLAASFTSNHGV